MFKFIAPLIAALALIAPSTAGANVRHAFQSELFGLTAAQRNATVTRLQNFLDGHTVVESSSVRQQTVHGDVEVLCEAVFSLKSDGDSVFDQAVARASGIGATTGANSGLQSYVRLRSVDDVARTITTRYAESPDWVEQDTVESLDA